MFKYLAIVLLFLAGSAFGQVQKDQNILTYTPEFKVSCSDNTIVFGILFETDESHSGDAELLTIFFKDMSPYVQEALAMQNICSPYEGGLSGLYLKPIIVRAFLKQVVKTANGTHYRDLAVLAKTIEQTQFSIAESKSGLYPGTRLYLISLSIESKGR